MIAYHFLPNLLKGMAIGDAFGAGVEFQDRRWITTHVDFSSFVNARHSIPAPPAQLEPFTRDYKPWDYSDDTEMAIALTNALLSDTPFSEKSLLKHLETEYLDGQKRKGHGRNGHGSLRWYFEGTNTIDEIRNFQANRTNPGNAPAIRALPIGLLPIAEIDHYATINALATHPHPHAVMASKCIAWTAHLHLLLGLPTSAVIPELQNRIDLDAGFSEYLDKVDSLPPLHQLQPDHFELLCGPQPIQPPYFLPGIMGVPSDSKYSTGAILYVLKHSRTAWEALQLAVRLGGDVDSIAAVATGLRAAADGLGSIPEWVIQSVEPLPFEGKPTPA